MFLKHHYPMNTTKNTFVIKNEHGDIIADGLVTSWSFSTDQNLPYVTRFDISGIKFHTGSLHTQTTTSLPPIPGSVWQPQATNSAPSSQSDDAGCCHKWRLYQGIMDSFDYCVTCGIKKTD